MTRFLLLSALSGMLELGGVLLAYIYAAPPWGLLLLPLAYQFGNLLCLPCVIASRRGGALCVLGLAALALAHYLGLQALFLLAVLLASLCIQAARSAGKSDCPAWLKRSFRIGGFLLAPVLAAVPVPAVACCLLVSGAALHQRRDKLCGPAAPGRIVLAMVFHQMHYFVYAYSMPVWVLDQTKSLLAASAAFALTWVVYLIPQTVVERTGYSRPRRMFFLCHSFLALAMAAMCLGTAADLPVLLCAAWMLTGLGGGSVFCIRELTPSCREADLTLSENVGHVLGVLVASLITSAAGKAAVLALAGTSCAFVCLTLLSAYIMIRGEAGRHGAGVS